MATIALDTETFLICPGQLAPPLVCVSWATTEESGVLHHSDPRLLDFLTAAFSTHRTVFANAPFDLAVLAEHFPTLLPLIFEALDDDRVHDVQIREKLLDLVRGTFRFEQDEEGNWKRKGYSLFDLAMRRLAVVLDKDTWRMRYHDLWDVPVEDWPEGARDYADSDAKSTLAVYEAQNKLKKYLGNEAAQNRAYWSLHLMSAWGIRTNGDAVDELDTRVRAEIEEVREELIETGLVRANGTRDTKAAVRRMASIMGKDSIITTAGQERLKTNAMRLDEIIEYAQREGKFVSVSEDAAIASGDETLQKYSAYTRLRNLLTGSVKHLRTGRTIPIQTRFEPLMETGRTSSSGPNLQNLRRAPGVRECFIPRDGHVLIACDYSMAELHTLAQVCVDELGYSHLAEALNAGRDVHLWLGAQLAGVSYEDAVELKKQGDEEILGMRQVGKAANFGFPGGSSAKTFVAYAKGYGIEHLTIQDGARIKSTWMSTWSEMPDYFRLVEASSHGDGWYYVQQPRVERIRSRTTFTAAANSRFQGLAADGAKAACYEASRRQYLDRSSALFGCRSLVFVHDEIIMEAPEDRAHEAAMELQQVMEQEFNKFVPDCPTQAEPTIMRYWSKKAKQVWEDGRLMPWS